MKKVKKLSYWEVTFSDKSADIKILFKQPVVFIMY